MNIQALWNDFAKDPASEFQSFCVQVLTKIPIKIVPLSLDQNQSKDLSMSAMSNRAIQNKAKNQLIKYANP